MNATLDTDDDTTALHDPIPAQRRPRTETIFSFFPPQLITQDHNVLTYDTYIRTYSINTVEKSTGFLIFRRFFGF